MRSLLKGWPGSTPNYKRKIQLLPSHFWGLIENNEQAISELSRHNIDWYFWDMPYYGRWINNDEKGWYWRVSKNSLHYKKTKNYPSDRFEKWGIQPRTYTTGSKILICPSSETMTLWTTGKTVAHWINDTIDQVKKYTDRPIEVRYKPRANGTSGPKAATIPINNQLEDTHCVITTVSLAAMEAQCMGIPTICHPASFAAEISSTAIAEIENPKRVDTSQWFYNLAYSQFTHDEIESGLAYEILHA